MKARSKALYAYLLEAGVQNGTAEEIDRAKCEYRRLYKKRWKHVEKPRKEIRIEFTLKQFAAIKAKAHEYEMKHTTYSRTVILSAVESKPCIAGIDELLKILQLVSRAAIAAEKYTMTLSEVSALLAQAENLILHYIKNETT